MENKYVKNAFICFIKINVFLHLCAIVRSLLRFTIPINQMNYYRSSS